jgi:MFS family permease
MGIPHRWYQDVTRGQWLVLAAALLGWLFDGFEMGIFPVVARPALIQVLGLSQDLGTPGLQVDAEVGFWNGIISAAFLIGAALGGWLFGWMGDRIGRVRAMALSILTYALFTGLCGLAQDVCQLVGLRFLAALGMGGEWPLGVALVMESWGTRARPILAGLIGAAANVGFFLTGPLVLAVEAFGVDVAVGGWRLVLAICAFPAVLTFLLLRFVPESEKWQDTVRSGSRASLVDIFAPKQRGRTLIGAALSGVALIVTWGVVQWIPLWVTKETGIQHMANYAQMTQGLGAVVGGLFGAFLGRSLGRRVAYFLLCLGAFLVCTYLFRWHLDLTGALDWRWWAVVFLTGILTAAFYGWLPLYLPELFPTRVRATGQGFAYNSGRIIAAVGAVSMGLLMQQVFAGDYARAGATVCLVYLAGMVLIWLAPETQGTALPE